MKITKGKISEMIWKFLIFISFFSPICFIGSSDLDIKFSLTCFLSFLLFICISDGFRIPRNGIVILIFVYIIEFTILNIIYLGCYWEEINRSMCFMFMVVLIQKGKQYVIRFDIMKTVIHISTLAMCFSLFLYFIGIDEISFSGGLSYRLQGHFSDNRLTYVFGHKSGYGLILLLVLLFAMYHSEAFQTKRSYYLFFIINITSLIATGSATAWCAAIVAVGVKYWSESFKNNNLKKMIVFLVLIITLPLIILYLYDFMVESRNLQTGGTRFLIWNIGIEYLKNNPVGLGHSFYVQTLLGGLNGGINNLHNVFLNEMLHFSLLNGFIFTLILFTVAKYLTKNGKYTYLECIGIWIPILMIMMIDNALIVNNLPIFFILIYLIFTTERKSEDFK